MADPTARLLFNLYMCTGKPMATSCGIKCTSCDYEEQFCLGGCAMDFPIKMTEEHLFVKLDKFSKQEKKRLRSEIRNAFMQPRVFAGGGDIYGWNFYYCRSCNRFFNLFYFFISFTGGSYTPDYKCLECSSSLELIDPRNINFNKQSISIMTKDKLRFRYKCPKCGAQTCEAKELSGWCSD
jgi:hypothetical protein